ncbi:glycosyltransferase [Flagellimonas nanhaiensis]|uniref:Glycosyltransferase n=1 Tax=Flagellimonas nanhaiensis TaxID=2292706 RepID=A0A371JKY5_9FLAO|nr:glycosyltransferase [Allomuricauda nanhaiensis]RDY57596.1 glycosyltransferase [Allomuricauda nanhaiensis]
MNNLISVIVPVYNAEQYLQRCVKSICKQSYRNLEIILVNDGSFDGSAALCDSLAESDKRIKVIHQENGGSSIARNTGLDNATGDIIGFVDSDDHLDSLMFEQMLELMISNNLDVIEIERDNPSKKKDFDHKFQIENRNQAFQRVISTSSFQVWKRLYRKSVVDDMRFIPNIIHQDVFYTIDVLNRIRSIGHLNSPLYSYNRENESVIRSKYTAMKRDIAMMATQYIKDHTPNTKKLERVVNQYIINYYTDHFYLLSKNKSLDVDKEHRKKLKREIKQAAKKANLSFRSKLILRLPIKVLEFVAWVHARYKNNF